MNRKKVMLWKAVISFADYPFQTYGRNGVGGVSGPKKLKIPGSGSYLYSLFLRLGVITDK